jgi:hypothetical protein
MPAGGRQHRGFIILQAPNTQSSAPEDAQNNCPKHVELTGIINKPLLLHLVGCLYYLYQWCTVNQISDNEIYLLIKYIKSVLWRVAKRLSCTEDARCLKANGLNQVEHEVMGVLWRGKNVARNGPWEPFNHTPTIRHTALQVTPLSATAPALRVGSLTALVQELITIFSYQNTRARARGSDTRYMNSNTPMMVETKGPRPALQVQWLFIGRQTIKR